MFNSPQPVLFYMCPSLIAGAMIVAYKRGEIKDILYSDNLADSMSFDDIDKGTKVKEKETKSNIEIPSISTMIETEDSNELPQVEDINIDEDDSDEEDDDE